MDQPPEEKPEESGAETPPESPKAEPSLPVAEPSVPPAAGGHEDGEFRLKAGQRTSRHGCLIFFVVLILLVFGAGGVGYWQLQVWSERLHGAPGEHALTIPPRTPTREIARRLRREGLVSHDLLFLIWLKLEPRRRALEAGEYKIKTPIAPRALAEALRRGAFERTLTIPEGWTAEQIAARLVREHWIARERPWLDLARNSEGFLFPETYRLNAAAKPETILKRMQDRFRYEWERLEPGRRDPRAADLTTSQVVVLASMVEREARTPNEMPEIASVYLNRLAQKMKLQCCATVRFALGGVWDRPLLFADLKTSSPYNTYLHAGLPPGPIANPGRAALAAVLRPAATDYLFYVYAGNDHHVFSRTYAEHLRAVRAARTRNPGTEIPEQDED